MMVSFYNVSVRLHQGIVNSAQSAITCNAWSNGDCSALTSEQMREKDKLAEEHKKCFGVAKSIWGDNLLPTIDPKYEGYPAEKHGREMWELCAKETWLKEAMASICMRKRFYIPPKGGALTPIEKKFEERCNELHYKYFNTEPVKAFNTFAELGKQLEFQVSKVSILYNLGYSTEVKPIFKHFKSVV